MKIVEMLRMKQLAGAEVPRFYSFTKNKTITESVVEVSLTEWEAIPVEWKGDIGNIPHFMGYKDNNVVVVPAKLSGGEPQSTELKDVVDAPVQKSEDTQTKNSEDVIAAVKSGKRQTDTDETALDSSTTSPEPTSELGKEKVKESAEDKAKKVIAAVKSGKRLTDTKDTTTDSTTSSTEPKTTLGDETVKELDLVDCSVDGKKVATESVEIAKRLMAEFDSKKKVKEVTESVAAAKKVIAAVKSGNHPHEVDGANNTATPKADTTDYNKNIDAEDMVADARDNVDDQEYLKFMTGVEQEQDQKVEVPSKVMSQIDQRIKDLKSSIEKYDNKGYNDQSVKQNAIDALEKIKEHLQTGNFEGLSQAIILYNTIANFIQGLMPAALPNFLFTATDNKDKMGHDAEIGNN